MWDGLGCPGSWEHACCGLHGSHSHHVTVSLLWVCKAPRPWEPPLVGLTAVGGVDFRLCLIYYVEVDLR